jgi:hypothetical protein
MSFHPTHEALFIFYEVIDGEGVTTHEGEGASEAVEAFKLAPVGARLLVSGWDTDDEGEARLVGQPLDVTALVGAVRGGWVW